MYVTGGRDFDAVLTLNWEYTFTTNTWVQKAPVPQPTNAPGSGAYGGRLHVFGGGNPFVQAPFETASTWAYDPILNTWSPSLPLNVGRSFPASTFVGGMALVAGGVSQYDSTDVTETAGEIGAASASAATSTTAASAACELPSGLG